MLISPSAMFVAFDTWIQAYFTAAFIQHFTDQLSLDRTFSLSPRSCLPVFLSQFFPKILACTTKHSRPTSARLLQPNSLTSWTAAPLSLLSTTLSLAQYSSARLSSAVSAESTTAPLQSKAQSELSRAELSLLVQVSVIIEFQLVSLRPLAAQVNYTNWNSNKYNFIVF